MRPIIDKKYTKKLLTRLIRKAGYKQKAGENAMKTNVMTKNDRKSGRSFCKTKMAGLCIGTTLLTAIAFPAFAGDDDIPFFAEGANGAPNVMFIFDNSDSMQNMPFARADSRPIRPGTDPESWDNTDTQTWIWQRGVQLNVDNTVMEDSSGRVLFDETAYPSDTEMAIPTQTPDYLPGNPFPDEEGNFTWTGEADVDDPSIAKVLPKQIPSDLPGYSGLTGPVTRTDNSERIYDNTSALGWGDGLLSDDDIFNENYRYRLVEVSLDPDDGSQGSQDPQIRMIRGRTPSKEYFKIDASAEAGGGFTYAVGKTYKYKILTDGPGRVTRVRAESIKFTDADVDWTEITGQFEDKWKGKFLTVTAASGAAVVNVNETREIVGYSFGSKYWKLESDLPVPCDYTCVYEVKALATDTSRIYDTDLDWSTPDNVLVNTTKFNLQYRYRAVEVRSKVGETVQRRTILSRNKGKKYFTIDTSTEAGGPLVYEQDELDAIGGGYTYTIMTDGPGPVTRARPDADDNQKITDAHLDWAAVDSEFDSRWDNRTIEIIEGTNKGETRVITDRSVDSKYWRVDTPFSETCDLTTRYKIVGTPDDDSRFAFGGNHPASKLYQAKKAMNLFLGDPALKYCAEKDANDVCIDYNYSLNIGFATYLSARVPRVHSRYYRVVPAYYRAAVTEWVPEVAGYHVDPVAGYHVDEVAGYHVDAVPAYCDPMPDPVPDRIKIRYKGFSNTSNVFTTNDSGTKFTAIGWDTAPSGSTAWVSNREFTGVTEDFAFNRSYSCGQTIRYTVTDITAFPGTDGVLADRHKFTVRSRVAVGAEGGYWWGKWKYFYGAAADCLTAPATSGSYTKINAGETCYSCTLRNGWQDPQDCYPEVAAYDVDPIPGYDVDPIPGYDVDPIPGYTRTISAEIDEEEYYVWRKGDHFNGYFNITDPNADYYVDPATQLTTAPATYDWDGRTWTRLDTDMNVSIDINGNTEDLLANTYDSSYFVYPGYGTEDRPHGWSYKKTVKDDGTPAPWIYGRSRWWDGAYFPIYWSAADHNPVAWKGYKTNWESWKWSKWGDDVQEIDYFPALVGDEMSNVSGHDQVVFVNLPEYDNADSYFGDDVDGDNLVKIRNYTSTARIMNPDKDGSWAQQFDYTIMPFSDSIAPNAYSAKDGSGTPIAASLGDLKKYYESYIKQDPKSLAKCRQNYVIFLTDGLESGAANPETAPVEAARALYEDIFIDSKHIPVVTYVIGFGMDTNSQTILNNIAAAGGTDHAYFADNVEALVSILIKDIVTEITGGSFSRSAPAISSYKPGEDLRLYSAYFDWPVWRGHLKAYDVDPGTGLIDGPAAGWLGDCDGDTVVDADAGCIMTTQGRGTVYTSVLAATDGTPLLFNPDDAATVTALDPFINASDTATVMRYILDPGYAGGAYAHGGLYLASRDPNWFLGDIYHSKPVIVGAPRFTPPPAGGVDPYLGYTDFKTDHAARETLVYVGANDGMVHAIQADNGHESWAYIPNAVLGTLKDIGTEGHRFTVDLTMKAADIFSPGGGSTIWSTFSAGDEDQGWHTLLTSGLRDGGYSYFALDITNAAAPKVAWETTDVDVDPTTNDMGKTWSTPAFGRLTINGVYKYVLFVGGGISGLDRVGNNFYIIDAASGSILTELELGTVDNNVPSEVRVVVDTTEGSPYYGNIKKVYVGDTSGDLYRISDLNAGAAWAPVAARIFDGVGKVFHKPVISETRGDCEVTVDGDLYNIVSGTTFIIYGTGDEDGGMMNESSTDRVYAIADPPLELASDPTNPATKLTKLWEYSFAVGEKLSSDPFIHLNVAYFVTYSPLDGCGKGQSFLWGLTIPRCGDPGGEDGIPPGTSGDSDTTNRFLVADGMVSEPTHGGPVVYIQKPGGVDPDPYPLPDANKLEYWREEF